MLDNVHYGPWKRRPLAQLVELAGGLQRAVDVVRPKPAHVHDDLLRSVGAKLECFASLARSLASECNAVHRVADAAALNIMADDAELRAANIELDLEIFD